MKTLINKPIDLHFSELINLNLKGIKAQVRNPCYINADTPPLYRTIEYLKKYKEGGVWWYELKWINEHDNCNFTGCTVSSDACCIQITNDELIKANKQTA